MPSIAKVSAKDCGNLDSAARQSAAPESTKGAAAGNVSSVASEAGSAGGRMSPAGGETTAAKPTVIQALNVLDKKIRNLEKRRVIY